MNQLLELQKNIFWTSTRLIIDFGRKDLNLGKPEHPKIDLRDSIAHRSGSLLFHLHMILDSKDHILTLIDCFKKDPETGFKCLMNYKDKLLFLFEDIIFNSASLFDYLGNIIGMFYLGENEIKMKWNGIVNACRDKNQKLNSFKISRIVVKQNNYLIDNLYSYRSAIIHYKYSNTNSKNILNMNNIHLTPLNNYFVNIPKSIISRIKPIKSEINENERNYFTVSYWLVTKCLLILKEIIDIVVEEIEPEIKEKMKEIIDKHKNNPK